MNKLEMYSRSIESNRQALSAFVKKYGYKENLGQAEYRYFREKVNACEELSFAEQADLCGRFAEMLKVI